MNSFNFESHTPPVVTEADLKRLAKARTLRRQAVTVAIGTALTLVAMLILSAAAFKLSPTLGAAMLILPIYTIVWDGIIIFVFIIMKKRSERRNQNTFSG